MNHQPVWQYEEMHTLQGWCRRFCWGDILVLVSRRVICTKLNQIDPNLELQTTSSLWLFQLDDSKSLHGKWLEITKHLFINGCLEFQELIKVAEKFNATSLLRV